MKPTRKNRFKKENVARRLRLRNRVAFFGQALRVVAALIIVSAGFILAHDFFMQSPQFRAHDIVVKGNHRLSRKHVLGLTEIGPQTNILALNLTTTRKRLLADPWIADATVSRQIPSGLTIALSEEQPLARLEMGDGQAFLLNRDGRVFKRARAAEGGTLVRIEGLSLGDLPVPGKPDTQAFHAVMTLLHLVGEQNSPLALADLRRIDLDRDTGATLTTVADDRAIKLGFGHYREKCSALKRLMRRMKADGRLAQSRVIDLYDVNRIVITLASAGEPGADREEG